MIIKADRKKGNIYEQLLNRVDNPNDSFTMKDYRETEIEWIPFDFTEYDFIKNDTRKWIDKLFTEDTTDRKGNWMLRGFTYNPYQEMNLLNINPGNYGNGYSLYGFNDEEMLIYTYCEGDTTLHLLNDRDIYEKEKKETIDWYRKEYAA